MSTIIGAGTVTASGAMTYTGTGIIDGNNNTNINNTASPFDYIPSYLYPNMEKNKLLTDHIEYRVELEEFEFGTRNALNYYNNYNNMLYTGITAHTLNDYYSNNIGVHNGDIATMNVNMNNQIQGRN